MNKKRAIAIIMAAVTCFTLAMPALAEDQVFTDDGSATVPVTCEIESSYKVSLPAAVALAKNICAEPGVKNNYAAGYTVAVTGNIDSDKYVNVLPDTSEFTLVDAAGKRPVTPEVYVNKTSWSAEDLDAVEVDEYVKSGSMIEASIPKAGKYSGRIAYSFSLGEDAAENEHVNASGSNTAVDDNGVLYHKE